MGAVEGREDTGAREPGGKGGRGAGGTSDGHLGRAGAGGDAARRALGTGAGWRKTRRRAGGWRYLAWRRCQGGAGVGSDMCGLRCRELPPGAGTRSRSPGAKRRERSRSATGSRRCGGHAWRAWSSKVKLGMESSAASPSGRLRRASFLLPRPGLRSFSRPLRYCHTPSPSRVPAGCELCSGRFHPPGSIKSIVSPDGVLVLVPTASYHAANVHPAEPHPSFVQRVRATTEPEPFRYLVSHPSSPSMPPGCARAPSRPSAPPVASSTHFSPRQYNATPRALGPAMSPSHETSRAERVPTRGTRRELALARPSWFPA